MSAYLQTRLGTDQLIICFNFKYFPQSNKQENLKKKNEINQESRKLGIKGTKDSRCGSDDVVTI